jgi:hypothetical protein
MAPKHALPALCGNPLKLIAISTAEHFNMRNDLVVRRNL